MLAVVAAIISQKSIELVLLLIEPISLSSGLSMAILPPVTFAKSR